MTSEPIDVAGRVGPVVSARSPEEIQALCDAATPAPWSFYNGDLWAGATAEELALADRLAAEQAYSDEAEEIFELAEHVFHGDPVRPEDAEFIAAARDLVPSLLAEVEAAHRFEQAAAVEVAELVESLERVTEERDAFRDERNAAAAERDSLRGAIEQALADWDRRGTGGASNIFGDLSAALAAAADVPQPEGEIVHGIDPGDAGWTTCCGMTPFELPAADRLASDLALVTCDTHQPADPPTCEHGKRGPHRYFVDADPFDCPGPAPAVAPEASS